MRLLPVQPPQVWFQALGRSFYQFASAVLLFYIPIVFVNYGHLSATQVGLASSVGAVAGFLGNFLGGSMTDSRLFGRRKTLIVSAIAAMITALLVSLSQTVTLLIVANLFFGISTGLYWTAADAAIMDSTQPEQRQTAFSFLGVADNLGFGLGTLSGGLLLARLSVATHLFGVAVAVFGLFLAVTLLGITETSDLSGANSPNAESQLTGWKQALTDGRLMIYLLVNTLFIGYMALVNTTLPLYFVNVAKTPDVVVSSLFTWGYIGLGALVQVPTVKLLARLSYMQALMVSMSLWGSGFLLIWLLGSALHPIWVKSIWAELAILVLFALATVSYKPTSAAWVAELAPNSLRGVYTAIAYQCWAIGYAISPLAGGWALDQPAPITQKFWLIVAISTLAGLTVLQVLQRQRQEPPPNADLASP
jgi:MFS family permease